MLLRLIYTTSYRFHISGPSDIMQRIILLIKCETYVVDTIFKFINTVHILKGPF